MRIHTYIHTYMGYFRLSLLAATWYIHGIISPYPLSFLRRRYYVCYSGSSDSSAQEGAHLALRLEGRRAWQETVLLLHSTPHQKCE